MQTISMVAVGPDDDAERQEWLEAIASAIDDRSFCLGSAVETFEARCCAFLDVPHAIGMNSGSDAIRLGLQAVGIGLGDVVVVPAYSFFATASSVAHLGATPRFVDVDPDTGLIDVARATAALGTGSPGSAAKAIIPVHLYGQAVPLDELLPACESAGVAVIEDAAQSFGVRFRGQALGSFGRVGAFSFYPTKNFGAAGDAGLAVSCDTAIAARLRSLRVHGDAGGYNHVELGWNARMDGFQGAILSARLGRLDRIQAARMRNAETYYAAIEAKGLLDRVRPLARTPGSEHGWHQFIVRIEDRERVRQALTAEGIGSGLYYPGILPTQPAFAQLGHREEEFPGATSLARNALALPLHHRLRPEDPERVIDAIAGVFR